MSFVYDDNGNLTNKTNGTNETNYIYNIEDRLVRVEDGTGTVIAEYYYDPFGRRLWKEVDGVRTYFLYADEGLVGEYDASGFEIKAYGYMPHSTWTTDPLFMKEGNNYYFYQNDHLGTPQRITGVNGSLLWEAKYSSFGEAQVSAASIITNNLRFPGQYFDQETGLNYNYHRYYDPRTGRYLKIDKYGIGKGLYHLYNYVRCNPIIYLDPEGLWPCRLLMSIPIGFDYETEKKWNKPGRWYLKSVYVEGGVKPIFWFTGRCLFQRSTSGVKKTTITVTFLDLYLCVTYDPTCGTWRPYFKQEKSYWGRETEETIYKLESIDVGVGWVMNEAAAKIKCVKKLQSLNY